jgi:hypothetical protein
MPNARCEDLQAERVALVCDASISVQYETREIY